MMLGDIDKSTIIVIVQNESINQSEDVK